MMMWITWLVLNLVKKDRVPRWFM